MPDAKICSRCLKIVEVSGDWYVDLCPGCADETDGTWTCQKCGRYGNFEEMGANGVENPVCCGLPCECEDPDDETQSECSVRASAKTAGSVRQFRLVVPTYFGSVEQSIDKEEYDAPHVPVLIHEAGGVRVVLGTHDYNDMEKPDIQIERRPNGWAIFLHPEGGGDPSGYVYFLDDGRSFVLPEDSYSTTPPIEMIQTSDEIREIDNPLANAELGPDEHDVDQPRHIAASDDETN